MYFVCGKECYCLRSDDAVTTSMTVVQALFSEQEEADTRIVLHCQYAGLEAGSDVSIVVRSPDTDVLVILTFYSSTIRQKVLFDTGTGNNRRIIDISSISVALGPAVSCALPSLHAFTGCDFTSAFVRRGKIKPLHTMEQSPIFTSLFAHLGNSTTVDDDAISQLESFVCAMYNKAAYKDANKL